MTTNCTEIPAPYASTLTSWSETRDSYGRRTRSLHATHRGQWGTVAVVVTLPKAWVESYGDDRYMVSDWRMEQSNSRPEPVHFRSLAEAKRYAESLIRRLTAEEIAVLDAYTTAVAETPDANMLEAMAQHHRDGIRAAWDTDRDKADLHEVMRRIVVGEMNRRTR
jgi:hypothetical protein